MSPGVFVNGSGSGGGDKNGSRGRAPHIHTSGGDTRAKQVFSVSLDSLRGLLVGRESSEH